MRGRDYELAEEYIKDALAEGSYRPHELVEHLGGWGVSADVASAVMWEMIGAGEIELSEDWHISEASNSTSR